MIDHDDLLREAKELGKDAVAECRVRTAVGRCYYAAFHYITAHECMKDFRAFKKEWGPRWKDKKLNTHTWITEYLKRSDLGCVRHAGDLLQSLLSLRIWADYSIAESSPGRLKGTFLDAYDLAEEVVEECLVSYDASKDARNVYGR